MLTRRDAPVLEEGLISRGDPVLQLTFVALFTCMCHSKGPASHIGCAERFKFGIGRCEIPKLRQLSLQRETHFGGVERSADVKWIRQNQRGRGELLYLGCERGGEEANCGNGTHIEAVVKRRLRGACKWRSVHRPSQSESPSPLRHEWEQMLRYICPTC